MNTAFRNLFVIIFIFLISGTLSAQGKKCDPETCTMKCSGNYCIELAGCDAYLDIYVLDLLARPLKNKDIQGSVEFCYLDETSLTAPLKQFFNTNSLRAKVPAPGFYNCKVSLFIGQDTSEVYFDNECDLRVQLIGK